MKTRKEIFLEFFPQAKKYRLDQLDTATLTPRWKNWNDATPFPQDMRESLEKHVPWISVKEGNLLESKKKDTYKTLLGLSGGKNIETVLMRNPKDSWTICVSSQVGCAMRCAFCATGKMGFIRNLTSDEIIDQYRYWVQFLLSRAPLPQKISNIVFMGMGEPLANYENVKTAIATLLKYAPLGETHITVSTVGVLGVLEKILEDPGWPPVRIAISLHSADTDTRKNIVPTSSDTFLEKLASWCKRYLKKFGTRSHYLTFEYVMLEGVNDNISDAKKLADFVTRTGRIRVNLIPYNFTGSEFHQSSNERMQKFLDYLLRHTVRATVRKTMGEDISAACGQLIVPENNSGRAN